MMLISPPPVPPYWPAYPEPKRSQLKAAYEKERAKWERECRRAMIVNSILPLAAVAAIIVGALIFAFGILPEVLRLWTTTN